MTKKAVVSQPVARRATPPMVDRLAEWLAQRSRLTRLMIAGLIAVVLTRSLSIFLFGHLFTMPTDSFYFGPFNPFNILTVILLLLAVLGLVFCVPDARRRCGCCLRSSCCWVRCVWRCSLPRLPLCRVDGAGCGGSQVRLYYCPVVHA